MYVYRLKTRFLRVFTISCGSNVTQRRVLLNSFRLNLFRYVVESCNEHYGIKKYDLCTMINMIRNDERYINFIKYN